MVSKRRLDNGLTSDEEIVYEQDLTYKAGAIGKIIITMAISIVLIYFFLQGEVNEFYILLPITIGVVISGLIWATLTKQKIYATNYRLVKTLSGERTPNQFEEVPYNKINGISFKTILNSKVIGVGILIILFPFLISIVDDAILDYMEVILIINILVLIAIFVFARESKLVIKISGGKGLTGTSDIEFNIKGKSTMNTTPYKVMELVQEMRKEKGERKSIEKLKNTLKSEKRTGYEKLCPDCGNPLRYVEEHDRWHCHTCQDYKSPQTTGATQQV